MIELLTFFGNVDVDKWFSKLWGKLMQIRQEREKELDEINNIMFGDPLELAKYYVEPDSQDINPANFYKEDGMPSKQPIMITINQFLEQPSLQQGRNQLFVLSDAGMGKSALLTMLKLMHMAKFWPQDRNCVLKKLGPKTLDEIESIKGMRKTILLLDSLDEDPCAYGRWRDRLMEILEASQHFAKVIITCRTQFFPKIEKDPLKDTGRMVIGGYSCFSKYLSFFDDQKVSQYLLKKFPAKYFGRWRDRETIDKINKAKKIIKKMGSLSCRPMLLSYIEDLMNSQLMEKGGNEYDIYDALIYSWLMREQTKMKNISKKDTYDAVIILAVWMQTRLRREISEADLTKLIGKISITKSITQIEMKGRSLINRNSEGNYRFSHYSIQEFCVAKFISKKPLLNLKKKIPITERIIHLIGLSMKLNPESAKLIQIGQSEDVQKKITKFGMEFIYIPPGIFKMGSPDEEPERKDNETLHIVLLSSGFYIQTTPVTQTQWESVMGKNPSLFKRDGDRWAKTASWQWELVMKNNPPLFEGDGDRPVETVSWLDAQDFIKKLNEMEGSEIFGLPTEAQWEYACRAGTESIYNTGDMEADLGRAGWYKINSNKQTHSVRQKEPNAFGLYDMHGNVFEWCQDLEREYSKGGVIDYSSSPPISNDRVGRGGAFNSSPDRCRSASRFFTPEGDTGLGIGLRLVLLPGSEPASSRVF